MNAESIPFEPDPDNLSHDNNKDPLIKLTCMQCTFLKGYWQSGFEKLKNGTCFTNPS